MRLVRRHVLRRLLLTVLGASVVCLIFSLSRGKAAAPRPEPKPAHIVVERRSEDDAAYAAAAAARSVDWNRRLKAGKARSEPRILVLLETEYSLLGRQLRELLDGLKFPYRAEVLGRTLPQLTTQTDGKYGLVLMENYYKYLNMDEWQRQLLDKYLRDFGAALVSFLRPRPERSYAAARVKGFPLSIHQHQPVHDLRLCPNSSLLRLARPGARLPAEQRRAFRDDWLLFTFSDHTAYEPIILAQLQTTNPQRGGRWLSAAIFDKGKVDGISRVLFGRDMSCWLVRLMLIDAVSALSAYSLPTKRLLQIDIDDIFVGRSGQRMIRSDVLALVKTQEELRRYVPGFRFQLGFSGKFFHNGDAEENDGDSAFIEPSIAGSFSWFGHMWRHNQAHRCNESELAEVMTRNRHWGQEHDLVVNSSYAVAPHHAGVYPVHEPLYALWRRVWGVRVTSTEEYPHQKPPARRRGFVHRDIAVLPRQTCGLFTKTLLAADFPGGPAAIDANFQGGELFFTFLTQPFLVFMTHSNNYANERLAPFLFLSQLRFLRAWTRLDFGWLPPLQLASAYFGAFPEEREPVWGHPCLDKKHLAIWAEDKSCTRLPGALVLGPQKTGTTALHTFLRLHPSLRSSVSSTKTFEEVQFFSNSRLYRNGIDWYMSFFEEEPDYGNSTETPLFFEKSATYFDSEAAPKRAAALVPTAKLIAILISPAQRAYSWFQHQRAHSDPLALSAEFISVLEAGESSELRRLRAHCLNPGLYARHIERWLDHFSAKQLLLVDGAALKKDPVAVMDDVTEFLGLQPVDYSQLIKFEPSKGFYCQVKGNGTKCLGRGKGRVYPPMTDMERHKLDAFFRPHNIQLHRLLSRLGYPIPSWLKDDLKNVT